MDTQQPSPVSTDLPARTVELEDFVLLMQPDSEQRERMCPWCELPKWFAYPILQAGYRAHFTRTSGEISSIVARSRIARPLLLVFNISLRELLLVLRFRSRCRLVSLFQWRPLDRLPPLKRLAYQIILSSSEQILVYSRLQETYVRSRFRHAKVRWIGLYVDTDFFQPQAKTEPSSISGRFLLVPGSHKRDENLVFELAETLRIPLVRFSSALTVAQVYANRTSQYVRFLFRPSFKQVRSLYQEAAVVLNIVDDSEWPVGITTFCEALAMDACVATPSGHSASGYECEDGTKPYLNVTDPKKVSAWCEAARALLPSAGRVAQPRGSRRLAQRLCSLETAAVNWSHLSSLSGSSEDAK